MENGYVLGRAALIDKRALRSTVTACVGASTCACSTCFHIVCFHRVGICGGAKMSVVLFKTMSIQDICVVLCLVD